MVKNYIHKYSKNIPLSVVLRPMWYSPVLRNRNQLMYSPSIPGCQQWRIVTYFYNYNLYRYTVFLPQSTHRMSKAAFWRTFHHYGKMSPEAEFFLFINQHCLICRPSEPRTVATTSLTVRRSHHSARSNPHSWTYKFAEISGQNLESSQIWGFCMDFINHREGDMVFYKVYLLSPLQCTVTEL